VKDKFGLSWQVVPKALLDMLMDKDRKKADRAMKAMLQMKRLDIAALERAFAG
jgi:predicted 3-demethylubiquinone-9 3-methyltransferase (glyoxalase superfamily)